MGDNVTDAKPFELRLKYDFSARLTERSLSGKADEAMFAEAWASLWAQVVEEVCAPERLLRNRWRYRTLDRTYLADAPGQAFLSGPAAWFARPIHPEDIPRWDEVLANGLARPPVPSASFVSQLRRTPTRVRGEQFAACFGLTFDSTGKFVPAEVVRLQLEPYEVWEGSLRATGVAVLVFLGGSVLLPLTIGAFNGWSAPSLGQAGSKAQAVRKIEQRLETESVHCETEANFHFDRARVVADLEKRFSLTDRAGVCEVQAALFALDLSPGEIDGRLGKHTVVAMRAFEQRWGLPANCANHPLFYHALAQALAGEPPPGK